jgi:precorrin-4/cobalt-precorrin-4 C11-methyltransferase
MRAEPPPQVEIVGIGPGADLRYLTEGARRAIAEADLVIFPGTLIGEPLRELVRGELRWGRWFDDAELQGWVRVAVRAGQRVAWLCGGDPTLYSGEPGRFGSLSSNAAWLRDQRIDFAVHPGVSSLQALLARMGMEHARADSGCPMAVYAPGRDPAPLARQRMEGLAALGVPMALFLADKSIADVMEIGARHYGPEGRVVIGHRVGWPDEWVIDSTFGELARRADDLDLAEETEYTEEVAGLVVPRHTLLLVGPWHG